MMDEGRRDCARAKAHPLFALPSTGDDLRRLLKVNDRRAAFESRSDSRREDALRIKRLRSYACAKDRDGSSAANLASRNQISALAGRLAANQGLHLRSATFASARWGRRHRLCFCGIVLAALRRSAGLQVALFTIVPRRGWLVPHGQLADVEPKRLLDRFRQQLVRTGLKCTEGWLIATLHGDYSDLTEAYQLHLHILAVGDAIAMVESLRNLPMFKPSQGDQVGAVRRPILKRLMSDPARQVSYYLAQQFWPWKPSYVRDSKVVRSRDRRRLPPARLIEVLMWLDRQGFSDLVMLHGCRASAEEIIPTRSIAR